MNFKHYLFTAGMLAILTAFTGCGRPPAGGGHEGGGPINAVVAEAKAESVRTTIHLVGSLKARNEIEVRSEISGTIAEISISEGEAVEAGQTLIRIDDAKIRARVSEAGARLDLARANFERARTLLGNDTISEQEFDAAKADFDTAEAALDLLKDDLRDTVIEAAFPGIVGERMVSPGQYVTSGQMLTRLVQIDPLDMEFTVPEVQLSRVTRGQEVLFTSPAYPDREISGRVFFVDPYINPDSRTVLAKAEVENGDGSLRPGLFGRAELVLSVNDNAVVIPEAAVRYAGDQASAVVMNREGMAEFRDITLGARMSNMVEITGGIAAGERVVVEGHQKIFMPGTPISISPDSARFGLEPEPPSAEQETAPQEQP